jgi:hypothetical protein
MSHLAFVTINYGRAPLGAPPHVTLTQPSHYFAECIVFIQIANNKGILHKKTPIFINIYLCTQIITVNLI